MSISFATSGVFACPQCSTEFPFDCWLVVAAPERPDLAARIANGTLHQVRCGQCGSVGEVQAPLLVYRPDDEPRLVFSPMAGATEDVDGRDANELLRLLRERLGNDWREEWLDRGLMVLPRTSVGLLFAASVGPAVTVVAADQAAESFWQRYFAERTPQSLDMAIDLWREALALAGESPAERVRCQLALGRCLAERFAVAGDLADLDAAAETLHTARETAPAEDSSRPKVLLVLGNVLSDRYKRDPGQRQDLDGAIECYSEAVHLLGDDDVDATTGLNNLAGALRDRYEQDRQRSDLDTAITMLERAIRTEADQRRSRALTFDTLAGALLTRHDVTSELDDLSGAIRAYAEAADRVAPDDPDRPAYLHNQALALSRRFAISGRETDALSATESFRAACRADLHARPARVLDASAGWALWASQQQAWSDVILASQAGLAALESLNAANVLVSDRQSWQRQARGLVMMSAYALARVGQVEHAAVVLESHWARQLNDRLERDGDELDALEALAPALHARYREAAAGLRVLEAEEVRASLRPGDASTAPSLAHLRDRFRAAIEELARVTAAIRLLPGLDGFAAPTEFRTIAESVQGGEALVYLVVTAIGSVAILVARSEADSAHAVRSEAVWADTVTVDFLDRLLVNRTSTPASGYLPAIFGADDPEAHMLEGALGEVLPALGTQLVASFASRLRALQPRNVALITGGLLKLLPVAAAPYLVNGESRCLLDEWTVAHVPSARALSYARRRCNQGSAPPGLLGIANPLPLPDGFRPLEYASRETRAIARHFAEGRATILEEADATYDAVAAGAEHATHLHFACHGLFSAVNPQLSLLVLSGGQPLLLYNVLYNVTMSSARLAVLSACDSAQIDYRHLPDEAVGLPAGFLQAGVPGVVGALWPVDDESTSLLMDRFYACHLGGEGGDPAPMLPAEALRQAQRWLRDETPFSSPLYWASFAFYGA